jgi:putative oxidoreductase
VRHLEEAMSTRLDDNCFEPQRAPENINYVERERVAEEHTTQGRLSNRDRSNRAGMMSFSHAALRVTLGVILMAHGLQKLTGFGAWADMVRSLTLFGVALPIPTILAAASMVVELFGGLLLILGLFTRFAALCAFVNMLMAILAVHAGHGLFAQHGGFEYPLLMLVCSAVFVMEGAGKLALDEGMRRGRAARREQKQRRHAPMGPRYAH